MLFCTVVILYDLIYVKIIQKKNEQLMEISKNTFESVFLDTCAEYA